MSDVQGGGPWRATVYDIEGSIVVHNHDTQYPTKFGVANASPHVSVDADREALQAMDETQRRQIHFQRVACAESIAMYLNDGGERPLDLECMERLSETFARSRISLLSIKCLGPFVDRDPPRCLWVEDESQEARDDRARLMDRLLLKKLPQRTRDSWIASVLVTWL